MGYMLVFYMVIAETLASWFFRHVFLPFALTVGAVVIFRRLGKRGDE